jgi:DNA-binding IclR family transcriptional regulator
MPETEARGDPKRSLLGRVDSILDAFDSDHPSLTLTGLVARTGLPKTTVYRTVRKMIDLRWVECHDGRYRIGGRLVEHASLGRQASLANTSYQFLQDRSAVNQTDDSLGRR